MSQAQRVHCREHGLRYATFVCRHLVSGNGLGFFAPDRTPISEHESDEQCAWCAECERVRQRQGGWDDVSEAFAGITMICDTCFDAARLRNRSDATVE